MRCWKLLLFLLFALNIATVAQVVFPSPTPTPRPGSREAALSPILRDKEAFDRMRSIEMMSQRGRIDPPPLLDSKRGIYRKPGKEEIAVLAPSETLLAAHAEFLKQRDTGIVKLSGDASCFSDSGVVVASERCLPLKMPGAGMAFSFRTETYRLPRLADLILHDGEFKTGGIFQMVVMTELGDVPLPGVTLESNGLRYLIDLAPAKDSNEFTRYNEEITAGVDRDGLRYRKILPVKENTTYAMRSIAYRGKYLRAVEGYEYNELDHDKRRDVIVAFRVVEKELNGNVTVMWKRLKDVEASTLKVSK